MKRTLKNNKTLKKYNAVTDQIEESLATNKRAKALLLPVGFFFIPDP